ncbi:outer membrane protein assembly factor BamB family protein [Mycolicibacterium arenosum]|uniref:PQQ-binding-like beta-propeller repeat protein n=1 Tax=Mycolicibacterium arenosum TaxID=2952157 RepID=A0ABT1MBL2_9MYCO|nr:PQQ-binding-like beta-propeller repeat protein [Mycolicibacterium sp. CAU 1645]MCP9276566.1 PQQ-binding-like beta-propeller repeat protein [Mycolicibacterium sp. CAU 1645]
MDGIRVSDGVTTIQTNENGEFQLPGDGAFVFVVRPTGQDCARWFVQASTPRIEFVLEPVEQPLPARLLHATDLHIVSAEDADHARNLERATPAVMRRAFADLVERFAPIHRILLTGDLASLGTPDAYAALGEGLDPALPFVLLPGNDDHKDGVGGYPHFAMRITRENYLINGESPKRWEDEVGPRWFSLDHAGLHIVAIDWNTHERDLDRDQQRKWLIGDLGACHNGQPWILLCHDIPDESFFDGLPSQPLATFSGHWHTDRVVRVGETLHVNTPPALFGGLDYSPPTVRSIAWDGTGLSLWTNRTYASSTSRTGHEPGAARWSVPLPGCGGLGGPVGDTELVVAATWDSDRSVGYVTALDTVTGEQRWQARTGAPVQGPPLLAGDTVVVQDVSGTSWAWAAADGTARWQVPSTRPLRQWCWTAPVLSGDLVVLGGMTDLYAVALSTGELVWRAARFAPHFNFVGLSGPVVAGDTVLLGSWPMRPALWAFDVATGDVRWRLDDPSDGETPTRTVPGRGPDFSRYAANASALVVPDSLSPKGPGCLDGERVYFNTGLGLLAIDVRGGAVAWLAELGHLEAPTRPTRTWHGVVTVAAPDHVICVSADAGAELWRTAVEGSVEPRMPGRSKPHGPLLGGATIAGRWLAVPGLDGLLRVLDPVNGRIIGEVNQGGESAATPLAVADDVILLRTDGMLVRLGTQP